MECAVCFGKEARLQRCGGGVLCACSLQICDECLEKWIDKKKKVRALRSNLANRRVGPLRQDCCRV